MAEVKTIVMEDDSPTFQSLRATPHSGWHTLEDGLLFFPNAQPPAPGSQHGGCIIFDETVIADVWSTEDVAEELLDINYYLGTEYLIHTSCGSRAPVQFLQVTREDIVAVKKVFDKHYRFYELHIFQPEGEYRVMRTKPVGSAFELQQQPLPVQPQQEQQRQQQQQQQLSAQSEEQSLFLAKMKAAEDDRTRRHDELMARARAVLARDMPGRLQRLLRGLKQLVSDVAIAEEKAKAQGKEGDVAVQSPQMVQGILQLLVEARQSESVSVPSNSSSSSNGSNSSSSMDATFRFL